MSAPQKLSKYWFPKINLIAGTLYALVMFIDHKYFYEITSIYVAFMISAFTYWLEKREQDIITESQALAFLEKSVGANSNEVVRNHKINSIKETIGELNKGTFHLNPQQLENYTCDVLKAVVSDRMGDKRYYATHIINNKVYLETWGEDCSYYKSMQDFVKPQLEILNNGGQVIRVFVILPEFLKKNVEKLSRMLEFHNSYYEGTRNKITTLVYVPKNVDVIVHDITIVNDSVVFEWHRSSAARYGYSKGMCYTGQDKESHLEKFKYIKSLAHDTSKPSFDLSRVIPN